ncbi:MAG: hypothetical protein M3P49_07025, partial [Actinomycetota bacterium]|nr:hypothetical protein [Actinomycetota bacterium]
ISEASRNGLLRCAVCKTVVRRMFGSRNRWHFAVAPGQVACDHENETIEHHETKLALFDALSASLPPGWGVLLEKPLGNGRRRPDVLATRESDGLAVAFEVQFADLSEAEWRERHEDYRDMGVRDVWLLGRTRQGRRQDTLAGTLVAEDGQRLVYAGRRRGAAPEDGALPIEPEEPEEPEGAARAEELLFGDGAFLGETRLLRPGSPAGEVYGRKTLSRSSWLARARRVGYDLGEIRLLDDGTLRTPADAAYEEAHEGYKRRRRTALGISHRKPERYAPPPGQPGPDELPVGGRRNEGEWQASSERAEALRKLGGPLLALIEREGARDGTLLIEPGRWKSRFFLEHVEGRVGRPLDFHDAAWGVMRLHRRKGEVNSAWGPLADFRDFLASEGFIRFVRYDKGMQRHWRIVRDSSSTHRPS